MIPLDTNAAASTPGRPGDSRSSEESFQTVSRTSGCRCCYAVAADISVTTSSSRGTTRRNEDRQRIVLRPRLGRVQRTSTRRRRCPLSSEPCADKAPVEETTCLQRNQDGTQLTDSDLENNRQTVELPHDPRNWSRDQVHTWVQQVMARQHQTVAPDDVIAERFPMNGKGLFVIALKPETFLRRLPCVGLALFHDFRLRVSRAMFSANDDAPTKSSSQQRYSQVKVVS